MAEVSFSDFQKLDMRIGKVISAEKIPGSKNLLKLQIDFGSEERQAVSGIKNYYKPEELVGKKFMFLLNLERKKFMGVESQCMIFAAEDEDGNLALMVPDKDIKEGSHVH